MVLCCRETLLWKEQRSHFLCSTSKAAGCSLLSVEVCVCVCVCVCVFVHYFMGELAGSHSCVYVPVHFKCAYICVCVTLHMWALAGILSCLQARVRVCTLMCA